jgi:hypothetical protein
MIAFVENYKHCAIYERLAVDSMPLDMQQQVKVYPISVTVLRGYGKVNYEFKSLKAAKQWITKDYNKQEKGT